MQKKYGEKAAFYIVYIREAHPTDGRQSKANEQTGIIFRQPKSLAEREDVALQMCVALKINLPCLLDGIDNKAGNAYAALPDRIYVVGTDGKIVYKGERGPRGFKPDEADKALEAYLAKSGKS